MTETMTYPALMQELQRLFRTGAYAEAYALLTNEGQRFSEPEMESTILYLRSCMAARMNDAPLAVNLLREALDKGYWFSEQVIRASPSWQSLQGQADFEEQAQRSIARYQEVRETSKPEVFVALPEREGPFPTVVSLHGNGGNGKADVEAWRPVTTAGWLLASVQSAQANGVGGFVWDDQAWALADVTSQIEVVAAQHPIERSKMILAGFSMGGETALRFGLTQAVPVLGLMLLGPGGPLMANIEQWKPLLEQAKPLRIAILLGSEEDAQAREENQHLVALLKEYGHAVKLIPLPGLAHEYPATPEPVLEALDWVLGGSHP